MMTATLTGSRWLMVPAVCRRECLLTLAVEANAYPPGLARDMAALLSPLSSAEFAAAWAELVETVDTCDVRAGMAVDALVGEP